MRYALSFYIAGIISVFLHSCTGTMNPMADVVLINGVVYTVDPGIPHASAIAIAGDRILAVGSNEEIKAFRGPSTAVIDLNGSVVTPGFIEGHGHFMGLGYQALDLDLSQCGSYAELIDTVRATALLLPAGTWIAGRGWHQDKWGSIDAQIVAGFPTHHLLSRAVPDHPVFLRHASGHAALANSRAMEIAGVGPGARSEAGGSVILDTDDMPTGIFNEQAADMISRHMPPNDEQRDQLALEKAIDACLRHGITGFHDAGQSQRYIDLYRKNIESGKMQVRLYVMLDGSDEVLLEDWFARGPESGDFLSVRSVKMFADGALGTRGALLLEAYSDMPGFYGHRAHDPELMEDVALRSLLAGFQMCVHAIGDRANREVLDLYERVFSRQPDASGNARFRIEHAQHLHPDDIGRFGKLSIVAAVQPIHFSSDRPWAIERLGPERIEQGSYAWQSLLESGARIVGGTDVPVEALSPMDCFYAAVTRKTLNGFPEGGYEPHEALTRHQALESYTIGAAYGAFSEHLTGSIAPGKLADLAVFDRDFMKCPENEIRQAEVLLTFVGGKLVYEAARP